jgi:ubiquinone biosynthesis protein
LAQAREALQLVRGIIVPRLLPWCTPRITAMERIDGLKVTEMDTAGALEFGRIARNVVHGLVAQPLFSLAPSAMFHADPHAGNLMLTGDGDVAVLDWALVGRLSVAEREQLAQIILGAVMLDPVRVCRAIDALCLAESASGVTPRTAALRRVVDAHLGTLRANGLPTAASITRLLDEAITRAGALFSKDVLHFRKATLMLEGVIADLGGDLDAALRSAAVEQLAMEWPARMISPPHLRTFGTRLSTIELTAAGWSIPLFLATRLLHTGQ